MNHQGGQVLNSISPPSRHPGGKKVYQAKERFPGHRTLWKRYRTNWALMLNYGGDQMWGSVLGRLYLAGEITETQAHAGKLYAELAANYDRMQGIPRRVAASPAYERRYGTDDEVERNRANGTINRYERKAKAAKKAWEKALRCIPGALATAAVDAVCIHDQDIPTAQLRDLATVLGLIAKAFGILDDDRGVANRKIRQMGHKKKSDVIEGAMRSLENWFRDEGATPSRFKLLMEAPEGERGVVVYGTIPVLTILPAEEQKIAWVRHTVLVKARKDGFMEAELDAMFLKACQARGWTERQGDT